MHCCKNVSIRSACCPTLGFYVDKAMSSNLPEFVRCLPTCAPTINAGMAVPTILEGDEDNDESTKVPPPSALGGDETYMRCSFTPNAGTGGVKAPDTTTTVGTGPPPAGDASPAGVEPSVALITTPAGHLHDPIDDSHEMRYHTQTCDPIWVEEPDAVSEAAPAGGPTPAGACEDKPQQAYQPSVSPKSLDVELDSLNQFAGVLPDVGWQEKLVRAL